MCFSLNQENTPEVGSLNNSEYIPESLRKLIELSSIQNLLIEYKDQVLLALLFVSRENSVYDSENYKFFNGNKKNLYILIELSLNHGFRRMGFGTQIYKYIDEVAYKNFLPICCEVNSMPKNEISLNFHIKNGYTEVGEKDFI